MSRSTPLAFISWSITLDKNTANWHRERGGKDPVLLRNSWAWFCDSYSELVANTELITSPAIVTQLGTTAAWMVLDHITNSKWLGLYGRKRTAVKHNLPSLPSFHLLMQMTSDLKPYALVTAGAAHRSLLTPFRVGADLTRVIASISIGMSNK